MDNLTIYNAVRDVPQNAKKTIGAGRLKGMTDINPMFRIKALTAQFGPCGIGWKYTIDRQWIDAGANDEICAFCNVTLYYKWQGEWSEGIPGTGGSSFVAKERNGLYTSDECFKMALTDALSVACKAIGVGADVYWDKDRTKYDTTSSEEQPPSRSNELPVIKCESCHGTIRGITTNTAQYTAQEIAQRTYTAYGEALCWDCAARRKKIEDAEMQAEMYADAQGENR